MELNKLIGFVEGTLSPIERKEVLFSIKKNDYNLGILRGLYEIAKEDDDSIMTVLKSSEAKNYNSIFGAEYNESMNKYSRHRRPRSRNKLSAKESFRSGSTIRRKS